MFIINLSIYADVSIDDSNVSKGLVGIKLSDVSGEIRALVEKSSKYDYSIKGSNTVFLPLQMGTGEYKVSVLENVGGKKYKVLKSVSIKASSIDEKAMYSASSPIVSFTDDMKAIKAYKTLTQGKSSNKEKAETVYNDVVDNYSYDFDKAKTLSNATGYVPIIDEMYAKKKGICYDYAAIMAGSLRSQGIPTKLVMGYAPEIKEYHAWNEIFIDGKWVVVDTTYDSQIKKGGGKYSFAKDGSKFQVVKVY